MPIVRLVLFQCNQFATLCPFRLPVRHLEEQRIRQLLDACPDLRRRIVAGAYPVAAENRHEEVFTPGRAAAGYLGKQLLGSARDVAKNVASERTWPGQVYLVHLVCLVCGAEGEKSATSGTGETQGWFI